MYPYCRPKVTTHRLIVVSHWACNRCEEGFSFPCSFLAWKTCQQPYASGAGRPHVLANEVQPFQQGVRDLAQVVADAGILFRHNFAWVQNEIRVEEFLDLAKCLGEWAVLIRHIAGTTYPVAMLTTKSLS